MYWPWNILDLKPDARSERDVKRAYAKKLKQMDPSQDPEKFQELRQAYEAARDMANFANDHDQDTDLAEVSGEIMPFDLSADLGFDPEDEDIWMQPIDLGDADPAQFNVQIQQSIKAYDLSDILAKVDHLLKERDFSKTVWSDLLLDPALDQPNAIFELENDLVPKISAALEYGPWDGFSNYRIFNEWMQVLEDRFGWVQDGLRFSRYFPQYDNVRAAFARNLDHMAPDVFKTKPVKVVKPPKIRFYFRWWFILAGYFLVRFLLQEGI